MGDRLRLFRNGEEVDCTPVERIATAIECWYDPHYRHWVLYPVDAEGNQLDEATYDFGKKNALATKKDMEKELIGKVY